MTTSWVSPDPLHNGANIFYSEITALYTDGLGNLVYFEDTDHASSSRRDSPLESGTRTWTSEANTIYVIHQIPPLG